MTEAERYLIGITPSANGKIYWLGSPRAFTDVVRVCTVHTDGSGASHNVSIANGVRPVVSTNTGVQITSGEGSTTNPFIAE